MASTVPMSRSRGSLSGLALVLLGAWGGLAPFIGPYFAFGFTPDRTWAYSAGRLYLSIIPGAVVLLAGLIVLVTKSRWFGGFWGFVAALAGAWFAVGQPALRLITGTTYSVGQPLGGTVNRVILTDLACFTGVGVLIVFFAALALGRQSIAAHKDHLKFGDLPAAAGAAGGLATVGLSSSSQGNDPYQATSYQPTSSYEPTPYEPTPYEPTAHEPSTAQSPQGDLGQQSGGGSYATTTNPQPVVGGQSQFPSQYPASGDPFGQEQQFPPRASSYPDSPDQFGANTNTYTPGGPITYSPGQTQYPPTQ